MYDWHNFDVVFQAKPTCSLDNKSVESILKHRKELGGTLFFDRVWKSLNLKQVSKNYPPKTNQELRALWQKIVDTSVPEHQKYALLLYVLLDFRHTISNIADMFIEKVYLSTKYQLLIAGLWDMDHGNFASALEHLTYPALPPTFTDEILSALIRSTKSEKALAMAYYIAVSPPLRDAETRDAYFALLCQHDILQAYRFCQTQGANHRLLFERLVLSVHSEDAGARRAERALKLIGISMTDEENDWFEECLRGEGEMYHNATDSIIARRIALGRDYSDIDVRGQRINGTQWGDPKDSAQWSTVS